MLAESQTMGTLTWGKTRPSKARRQIYCHWIFCHGSKSLKIYHEQIMHCDRPAHILSLLCKHHNADWHYCTNQATHTKSRTVVCNKLQPSSQSRYAPRPRYLALYWKKKKPGGSTAGLPRLPARGRLRTPAGGTGRRCGRRKWCYHPFSDKASTCRSTVLCPQQETQPWDVLTHRSVVPCSRQWFLRHLPCKRRAVAISFLYTKTKEKTSRSAPGN